MLRIERITLDGDRWTAELTFAPIAFDPHYWLSRSEGFLVDSPEGVVGVVGEVVQAADGGVAFLAVSGGWFGGGRHLIAAGDVREIYPGPQRLLVRVAAARRARARGAGRFPFNLLERVSSRFKEPGREAPSGHRSVEVALADDALELLAIDRAR